MTRSLIAPTLAAALLVVGAPAAFAASAQEQDPPPSIAQLCLATSIEEVDALLDGVASSGLAGALEPLATLVVPGDADTIELRGSVTLDDVREQLDCQPATDDPDPTETPDPTTEEPAPSTEAPSPDDGASGGDLSGGDDFSSDDFGGFSGDGFSQLDTVPSRPAETGGGPAA